MVQLPLTPFGLRFRILGKINSMPLAHIMHAEWGTGGPPSVADCTSFATSFRNAFNTRFASQLPTSVSYNTFECADLSSLTGAVGTNTTAVTGTASAVAGLPNSTCAVVSWKQALRYRGGHPRTYFPYGGTAPLSGNALPAGYQSSLLAAATNFISDVNAITSSTMTLTFCAISYYHGNVLRPVGVPLVITAAAVHARVDTQRRRLGKEF